MEQEQLIKKEYLTTPVPLSTSPAIRFCLSKKAIVLLVVAVVVLGCALTANLIHTYWTPSFTADASTSGKSDDDEYLPLPVSAPSAAAAPALAVVMEAPAPPVDSGVPSPGAKIQDTSVEPEATATLSTGDENGPDTNET
ncbi:hypothetical protein V5799_009837, partial [Amblyomma americanum]